MLGFANLARTSQHKQKILIRTKTDRTPAKPTTMLHSDNIEQQIDESDYMRTRCPPWWSPRFIVQFA